MVAGTRTELPRGCREDASEFRAFLAAADRWVPRRPAVHKQQIEDGVDRLKSYLRPVLLPGLARKGVFEHLLEHWFLGVEAALSDEVWGLPHEMSRDEEIGGGAHDEGAQSGFKPLAGRARWGWHWGMELGQFSFKDSGVNLVFTAEELIEAADADPGAIGDAAGCGSRVADIDQNANRSFQNCVHGCA